MQQARDQDGRRLRLFARPARNLRGGILVWIAAGGGLVDAQLKPSHQVHVYAKAWAAVPDEFEAIYWFIVHQ